MYIGAHLLDVTQQRSIQMILFSSPSSIYIFHVIDLYKQLSYYTVSLGTLRWSMPKSALVSLARCLLAIIYGSDKKVPNHVEPWWIDCVHLLRFLLKSYVTVHGSLIQWLSQHYLVHSQMF